MWGLTTDLNDLPLNPVFSPDGSAILFSAVQYIAGEYQRHIFYWRIGSPAPVNLTAPLGNLRHEDPKFSPQGNTIVWKEFYNIVTAGLKFNSRGVPALSGSPKHITNNGAKGTFTEASGPSFSRTGKYIYYWTGSGSAFPIHIHKYDVATKTAVPLPFPQAAKIAYYYPVDPDLYDLLYVSWPSAANPSDKIYLSSGITGLSSAWNAADCSADNSDPAPVDEDYFIYSRDHNTDSSSYELYLGQLSTDYSWSVSSLGLNNSAGDALGANYTNVR